MRSISEAPWACTVMLLALLQCNLSVAVPEAAGQQAPSRSRFLTWAYQDAGDWATSWESRRSLRTAGLVAILVPISFLDEEISEKAAGWDGGLFGDFLNRTNGMGDPLAALIPVSVFAASLTTDSPKFQDAAFTSLQSLVYTNLISFAVKFATGRSRPKDGKGAHDFNPLSGATSFPSGHTATAFAILLPWVFYYPNVATYGLLVVATGTALARLQRQRHWLTDVLTGTATGITMSYWLSRKHQGRFANSVEVRPALDLSSVGMVVRVVF